MTEPPAARDAIAAAVDLVEAAVEQVKGQLGDVLNARRIAYVSALEQSAAEAGDVNAGDAVEAYADRVSERVWGPLLEMLRGDGSADRGLEAWERARERLDGSVAGLPHVLTRPEPPGLYEPRSDDSAVVRLRKAAVRSGRALSNVVRWPGRRFLGRTAVLRTQTIPLRQLAAYHLRIRAPRALSRMVDRANRDLARATTYVERASSDWVNDLLGGPDGEDAPSRPEVHDELLRRLEHALELAREVSPPDSPALPAAATRFRRDVEESGTFMLDMAPFDASRTARVEVPVDGRWAGFYDRAANRLALARDLVALRRRLSEQVARFEQSVDGAVDAVGRVLEECRVALQACRPAGPRLTVDDIDAMESAAEDVVAELDRGLSEVRGEAAVQQAADLLADGVTRVTRQLPAVYNCQDIQDDESMVSPAPHRRDYRLQEVAETAFDALAIEQLRSVAEPLAAHFQAAGATPDELRSILEFNLSAAADDLGQEDPDVEAVLELVQGACDSATAIVDDAGDRLREGVKGERPAAKQALEVAWSRLHARVRVEAQRQDELLGAWNRLRGWVAEQREGTVRAWRGAEAQLRSAADRTRIRVLGALRRGRTAVLQPQVTDADIERTLVAVQEAGSLTRKLPVVYQRLFALAAATDPDLTVGRDASIDRVRHLRRRWEGGVAPILAVTAPSGTGKTSFLNLLVRKVFDDCRIVRLDLADRITDPAAFFRGAVDAAYRDEERRPPSPAEPEPSADGDPLQQVSQSAFEALESLDPPRPVVVMAEPLEHLFTRRVGGADLVEAVLTQLRRSPSAVWWILTATDSAWELLETLAPNAATLASQLELSPLDREQLEEVILTRHRKSGLPLRFDEPPTLSRRAQREARRALNEDARQAIYRTEFFDRLHRISSGDLTLAQFYWLRSLELDRHERILRVRTRPPLSFAFLSDLDLDRAFALKAFLDHGSLTPREYGEITGSPLPRCLVLFESLFGLRLIHPRTADTSWEASAVAPEERYHIHPLVVQPVMDFLVGQRILH